MHGYIDVFTKDFYHIHFVESPTDIFVRASFGPRDPLGLAQNRTSNQTQQKSNATNKSIKHY